MAEAKEKPDGKTEEPAGEAVDRSRSKKATDGEIRCKVEPTVKAVPDEDLEKCMKDHFAHFVCGEMAKGQRPGDERESSFYPDKDTLPEGFPMVKCVKGSKGARDETPNQDNYSIAYFKDGHILICCMDGHGSDGHESSTHAVVRLPYFLATSKKFPKDMAGALTEAFEKTQDDMIAVAYDEDWDCWQSGTTAAVSVIKGNKIWSAHVGDSRCVVGSTANRKVMFTTEDHKPTNPDEQARIEKSGGEVKSHAHSDGKFVSHRVFLRDEDIPGLAMSRSLGDCIVKAVGVIATPVVEEYEVDYSAQPFLFLGSDGVFEFLSSEAVVKEIAKKIKVESGEKVVGRICQDSRKKWEEEENFSYVDDITGILFPLKPDLPDGF